MQIMQNESSPTDGNNKKSVYILTAGILSGWLFQAILCRITWHLMQDMHGVKFALLVVFALVLLAAPLIWNRMVEEQCNTPGILAEPAIAQGLFFIFPFLMIDDWSYFSWVIEACLIIGAVIYAVSVGVLASLYPENTPTRVKIISFMMQACFAFAIGTVVSLVFAFIFALAGGGVGSKKKK